MMHNQHTTHDPEEALTAARFTPDPSYKANLRAKLRVQVEARHDAAPHKPGLVSAVAIGMVAVLAIILAVAIWPRTPDEEPTPAASGEETQTPTDQPEAPPSEIILLTPTILPVPFTMQPSVDVMPPDEINFTCMARSDYPRDCFSPLYAHADITVPPADSLAFDAAITLTAAAPTEMISEQRYFNSQHFILVTQRAESTDHPIPEGEAIEVYGLPAVLERGLSGIVDFQSDNLHGEPIYQLMAGPQVVLYHPENFDTLPPAMTYTDAVRITWVRDGIQVTLVSDLSLEQIAVFAAALEAKPLDLLSD